MRPGVAIGFLLLSLALEMTRAEQYRELRGRVVDATGAQVSADVCVVDPKTLRVVRSFAGKMMGCFEQGFCG